MLTRAEKLGYQWACEDEQAVDDVREWVLSSKRGMLPEADDSYLPIDANDELLLQADPSRLAEYRKDAVAGYTLRLLELWRDM